MTDRIASRRAHQRFCEIEGWVEVRNARGRPTQHDITYELPLDDGRILRTRISRPANADRYGRGLWAHILHDQLDVTVEAFWECVEHGNPPRRTPVPGPAVGEVLPAGLAYQLVHTLGLTSDEIAGLTLDEAVRRMAEFWAQPPD